MTLPSVQSLKLIQPGNCALIEQLQQTARDADPDFHLGKREKEDPEPA
jgi:hypothetical protein